MNPIAMASSTIPCSVHLQAVSCASQPTKHFRTPFMPPTAGHRVGWLRSCSPLQSILGSSLDMSRTTCFFNFGTSGVDAVGAGIYGSQSRDDFSHYDVEQYFDYMGMLAVEGSYDSVEALLQQGNAPVDVLLMLAASEGDKPKIEELMRAGAMCDVKDIDGRTALDRAAGEDINQLILELLSQRRAMASSS